MKKECISLIPKDTFIDIKELAEILNITFEEAIILMQKDDFPSLEVINNYVVYSDDFIEWQEKESWKKEFVSNYNIKNNIDKKEHEQIFEEAFNFIKQMQLEKKYDRKFEL